jgi:hypothetical protein
VHALKGVKTFLILLREADRPGGQKAQAVSAYLRTRHRGAVALGRRGM